jgi:hypothetical protein
VRIGGMADDMCVSGGTLQNIRRNCSWLGPDRTGVMISHFPRRVGQFVYPSKPIPSHKVGDLVFLYQFSALNCVSLALVMKNIAISGTWRLVVPGSNITTAIVDVDRACLWMASERLNVDADVEIDIHKKGIPDDSYEMEDVSALTQGLQVMNWSRKTMQIHCDCR